MDPMQGMNGMNGNMNGGMNNGFSMPASQLMNHQQPPQIFGAYGSDVSHLNDMASQMFGDPGTLLDESNEAKRRRIARACDMCRKKKIKCDGKLPSCTHCLNYKTECIFTQVEKKRNPPKGAKYIEGLENRLGRMENLLRLSGLLDADDKTTDLGTLERKLAERDLSRRPSTAVGSHPSSPQLSATRVTPSLAGTTPQQDDDSEPRSGLTSPDPHFEKEKHQSAKNHFFKKEDGSQKDSEKGTPRTAEEVEDLSDMMCSLVTNNCGETRYIGSSSGFSIFSPKGIEWVNEKTGDASFQEMISSASVDDNKWMYWKPEVYSDLFERRIFRALPPKVECLSLLTDYFENFNCMFPLFHRPTFMYLVDRQYSNDPYEGSGWWASLNVALALAHRLRVMSMLVPAEEDQKAWGYLKNAMAVQAELTMRNTDLLSVQALLGIALFMQGTPNPQPSYFLVAAAIRLSHSIGLHKRGSSFNLNPVEIEQRKRVFWIGYMLDKDICLRSGRPPAQDDDDMNVELPSADPEDNIGNIPLADGKGKVNLFRLMCEFATIESKVYKQLYSTKASKLSDGELLNTIGELDQELEEWKDSIPVDFRPEHEIKASHTPLILHIVVLHFSYYNCLTTIHRMSIHHGYWTSRLSNYAIQGLNARPLNPRIFSSAALCVSAARASIHLIKYVPQGDFACVWMVLYFPVSALMTLFGNILQNPQDPRARSDVRLMSLVVTFLSMLATEEENGGVKRMLGVCSEFERIAKVVLDKQEKESSSRRKRKSHDDNGKNSRANVPATPMTGNNANGMPGAIFTGGSVPGAITDHTGFSPLGNGSPSTNGTAWMSTSSEKGNGNSEYHSPSGMTPFADIQAQATSNYASQSQHTNGNNLSSPININNTGDAGIGYGQNSFEQPFVPQDLWQMPMTLEWDWADMTGGAYPSFENGVLTSGPDAGGLGGIMGGMQ